MAPRFGAHLAGLAILALACWQALDMAFLAPRHRMMAQVTRRARGGESETRERPPIQPPEVNYFTNSAIMDCLKHGCSVNDLDELENKLLRDEAQIETSIEELRQEQSASPMSADIAEVLGWFRNVLENRRSMRTQIHTMKDAHQTLALDFASQYVTGRSGGLVGQFLQGSTMPVL